MGHPAEWHPAGVFGGPPYLFLYLFSHLAVLMHAFSLPIYHFFPLSDILPDLFTCWPSLVQGGWAVEA